MRKHVWRAGCGLVRSFRLARPSFRRVLKGSYRLARPARVTLTVMRGRKVVKRIAPARRARLRFAIRGLKRGVYRVRLVARSGDEVITAVVAARRV